MNRDKAVLLHPGYTGQIPSDYVQLKQEWFNHGTSVLSASGLAANSLTEIRTFGVLEKALSLRDHVKKLDYLLLPGGLLVIQYYTVGDLYSGGHFIRPLSFLMHEISLSFGKRFLLIKKRTEGLLTELVYKKVENSFTDSDSMQRWTFGIVSDGRKDERIKSIIEQIRAFGIPAYEIVICGPHPKFQIGEDTKVYTDEDLYADIRVPITSKKNRIINNASYDNIVLMHDRISFPKDWYRNMSSYGNSFEILTDKILDEDTHSLRVQDWMNYDTDLNNYIDRNSGYLAYAEWLPSIYVDGGFIIAKRNVLKSVNGYNEALHWGEAEDLDLSVRLYNAGYITNIDLNNSVFTQTHRHPGIKEEGHFKKLSYLRRVYRELKDKKRKKKRLDKERQEFIRVVADTRINLNDGYQTVL